MAGEDTVSAISNYLRDEKGDLAVALKWATVLMSELEREQRPQMFSGEKIKVVLELAPQQGSAMITETGTLNTPLSLDSAVERVDTGIASIAIGFSTKAVAAAKGDTNSWMNLIPHKMDAAMKGMKRIINEQFLGNGDALIAAVTGSTSASGGGNVTQDVKVGTSANFYQLYANRVVDILTRSNGAVLAAGVKISDYSESAGTITTSSAAGGYATTNTAGVYIQGSYGNAIAGLGQITATTGTFQNIDKALTPAWRGTDVSPSAANTDPTLSIFAKAERKSMSRSGDTPTFYLGDPAVIDKFEQLISLQANWAGQTGTLETGWEGIKYRGKLFIREFDTPANTMYGIHKPSLKVYTRDDGPSWDELDGAMAKRIGSRSLPFEYWLIWMLQLATDRCGPHVKIGNLAQAA